MKKRNVILCPQKRGVEIPEHCSIIGLLLLMTTQYAQAHDSDSKNFIVICEKGPCFQMNLSKESHPFQYGSCHIEVLYYCESWY